MKSKLQAGETIVEVLIAIAVLATALGGAFSISTRAKNTMQANQERYQAQLIANSQADLLKLYMLDNSQYSPKLAYFCMYYDETNKSYAPIEYNVLNSPPANCTQNSDLYSISITQTNSSENIYLIKVIWDSLINGSQDQVELAYGT